MKNIKQYYKELGKLVYALAISDGSIQQEEQIQLHNFVANELASHEIEVDSSGMNKAFYVDFEFEKSVEAHLDRTQAIISYRKFVERNYEKGDDVLIKRALTLLEKVNQAYSKQKEKNILEIVREQIDELNKIHI